MSTEHRAQSTNFAQKINKALHHSFSACIRFIGILVRYIKILPAGVIRFLFKKIHLRYLVHKGNFFNIPIYIISYNRLEYLQQMLKWLERYGYRNIIIIDNNSDYEPLLDFYKNCAYKIIHMKKNYGHTVFYKHPRFIFKHLFSFYVLTDPDLTPIDECRSDFMEQFLKIMADYPEYQKVGFSLKIDDLPEERSGTVLWERNFWEHRLKSSKYPCDIYSADIDTTFALNSPTIYTLAPTATRPAIRTGIPYQVRHLPWYVDKLNDETLNYVKTARTDISSWGKSMKIKMKEGIIKV